MEPSFPACFSPLLDLSWYTLRIELRNTFARQHPLAVFAALCKHAANKAGIPHHEYFYHPLEGPPDDRIRKNTIYPLELVFPHGDSETCRRFLTGLNEHLENPRNNFALHRAGPDQHRCLTDLLAENPLQNSDEVCLEFITPFPFTPTKEQGQRHLIDRDIFFRKLEARIKRTFDLHLPGIENSWAGVRLLTGYWEYYERQRNPCSNKGKQYINGTVGPLYLQGEIALVYPLLLLCSEINNGRRSSFGLGHYRLLHQRADLRLTESTLLFRKTQENVNLLQNGVKIMLRRGGLQKLLDKILIFRVQK